MSDFLGRVGRITEWVVVSNLENRAVNAACDKAQDWWKHRKHKKDDANTSSTNTTTQNTSPSQIQSNYPTPLPQYQSQQPFYMQPPQPVAPSMSSNEILINVNQLDGLTQSGPFIVIIECNYQRYETKVGQTQQQFSFPVYQFEYDQLFIWIQTEYQPQTIASGTIPIRILLNNNSNWTSQQQRWIPLRDYYNGPAGQLLVTVEYRVNHPISQYTPIYPPPYTYYP